MGKVKKGLNIKEIVKAIVGIVLFLVIVIGPIIINHFFSEFSWFWIIFIWIFIFSPLLIIYFKKMSLSHLTLTEEQLKKGNTKLGLLILWYWYLDVVYLVIFNEWSIPMYILISLTIIKIFYDLVVTFLNRKMRSGIFAPALIINFVVGIGLVVFLIFKIPDESLRNILTAIVGAVLTGLITLVGVAWTITHANEEKNIEEIKKNKPFVFMVDPAHTSQRQNTKVSITQDNISNHNFNTGKLYSFGIFILENSDYSHCTMKGFCINGEIIPLLIGQAFRKNEQYVFIPDFAFKYNKEIRNVSILLIDMLDNYYELEINFYVTKKSGSLVIDLRSGIETRRCDVDFNNNKIIS